MFSDAEKASLRVGFKQAMRALKDGKAEKIFLAENCDGHIKDGIENSANENNTPIVYVSDMKELGAMCSISVGASCAVVIR